MELWHIDVRYTAKKKEVRHRFEPGMVRMTCGTTIKFRAL